MKGIEAGCDDFLSKPLDKMELFARVRSLLQVKAYNDLMNDYQIELEAMVTSRTEELRHALENLEQEITERKRSEEALQERVKELNCLQALSRLIENEDNLERIFQQWVDVMPDGWYYPEIACVRILFEGRQYQSENFREADWRQSADLKVMGKAVGIIELYYFEERPLRDEGPFLMEERNLINLIGERLGNAIEKLQGRDALRESEENYRFLFDNAPDLTISCNTEGVFLDLNKKFEEESGYSREEMIGKSIFTSGILAESSVNASIPYFEEILAGKKWVMLEVEGVTKDGGKIPYELMAVPIKKDGKIVAIQATLRNITEHRKLEAQLRHSQKMEAVGTLAGGIAHDFNNSLNVIMGYGVMVKDTLVAGSPAMEDMNEVLSAADRAADLTNRLLVFSRKKIAEVTSVNINALILGLKKLLGRIIKENIEFNLDLTDRPLAVMADVGEMEQVLINLASNAKDAMPEGGRLTISTGLEEMDESFVEMHGYGKPGRYALITVSDTGPGMDAEIQKKLFEPFFTTKGVGEGTGLGLAISYGIIKQHDGFIKVYSELGQGTAFKIFLPLSEETASEDKKADAAVSVMGGNETILIAEDEPSLRKLARTVLESFGYSVILAEDGEDAITKFMENKERISLVMLDMIMPKKSGKEVRDAIIKVTPRMKVLFASGYAMDKTTKKELRESDFDFIHKPFRSKDLLIKVREILDR
ncbi:MAG: PAS domain S-box protein [Desulfotignum sp.]|nr:PAS domain S-box protein [Desulfotignum sp.]